MKIGMVSLGCPKNLVDSEVMLGLAQQAGHELTRDPAGADVIVVNTCAFIDKAKQESVDTILEMAEFKKTGSCRTLVVAGCLAERYRDELKEQIPEIDFILGTGDVPAIVQALGGPAASAPARLPGGVIQILRNNGEAVVAPGLPAFAKASASLAVAPHANDAAQRRKPRPTESGSVFPTPPTLPTYLYDAETPRLLATPRHYAYIKIAEGCDYKCGFCIIPKLRGHYRSRPHDSILSEARSLAARGVKELLLISQDTTFYGIDRGERGALARLLGALQQVDGIEWIRMLYLYPTTIGDDVLEAMAVNDKVCRYIDLPLQHASDAVLKRMKRPGTRASYERLLERIRQRMPDVALRTTFIVGYPGETAADFAELQAFITAVRFDHVGVFTYSHEEDTSAHALVDDVPARTKQSRQASIMALQKRIVARTHRDRVGQRVRLLVDGPSAEHELVLRARTAGQAPDIDPLVYLTECDPSDVAAGQFLDAEIVASREYDLLARPLAVAEPA
jgi:ribosomal protein S12 methylthiotransferase